MESLSLFFFSLFSFSAQAEECNVSRDVQHMCIVYMVPIFLLIFFFMCLSPFCFFFSYLFSYMCCLVLLSLL